MKRFILILLSAAGFGFCQQAVVGQSWNELLTLADSLSKAQNQDSAIFIGKLALERAQVEFGGNDTASARVLYQLGFYHYYKSVYDQADTLFHQALAIREDILGPEHPDVASSLNILATIYVVQARYAEAEPLYKRVLAICKKARGPDHPSVARSLINLASVYDDQARYAEAEPLLKRALAILEKALGPDHPDVASSLNNLAAVYKVQARYADAEPLYKRALAIREKALGPDHPEVASVLNNLANVYSDQARYADVEPLRRRALAIIQKALGPDHPKVAVHLTNLASVYVDQARYAEAEPLHKRALAIREKALGPDHPEVASVLNSLANVYYFQARYAEAEPLYKRALAIREKALGPDHPDVASGLNNLAIVYYEQARYADAEPLQQRALAIQEKVLGPDHPGVASSLNILAAIYVAQARNADAEPLFKRALAIQERTLGPDHVEVATYLSNLAHVYRAQARYGDAEPLLKRALAIREQAQGPNHPDAASSLKNLANIYAEQERYAEAEQLYKKALVILEKALGPDHPDVAEDLNNLANVYYSQARYTDAEPLYKRALAIQEKALGPDHPDVATTREARSILYRDTRQPGLAVIEARKAFSIRLRNYHDNAYVLSERDALTYSQAARNASGCYLSCFADIGTLNPEQSNQGCTAVLESKGIVSEEIMRRQQTLTTEKDSVTLALVESLRNARFQMSKLYTSGPGNDAISAYKKELDSLAQAANNLEAELSRHSASFQRRKDLYNITVARIDSVLPANSSLIEYLKWDYHQLKPDSFIPKYVAVVLKPTGGVSFKDIGKASTIDSLVGAYRKHFQTISADGHLLSQSDQEDYRAIASRLYDLVWKPVLENIPENQMVFVSPDGALNLVSFAGLMDESGKYLIERYKLHYVSAGRDVIRYSDTTTSAEGLFALGDPDFDASVIARAASTIDQQVSSTTPVSQYTVRNARSGCESLREQKASPLPGTRREIEKIARNWEKARREPVLKYFGPDASEEHFKGEAKGHRVIHLATHGYFMGPECQPNVTRRISGENEGFVGENPLLLSGLLLAGANLHGEGSDSAGAEDGILTALEISGMDFTGTDLVVLSACETGLGEAVSGEGVYGLRRSFLLSGARTVVSSLWPVSDQATSELMGRLYQGQGKSLPDVIREYSIEKITTARKRGAPDHPYYWAPFIAIGDWRLN